MEKSEKVVDMCVCVSVCVSVVHVMQIAQKKIKGLVLASFLTPPLV